LKCSSQAAGSGAGQGGDTTVTNLTALHEAGIAVVTAANGDGFQGHNRLRQAKHQQQG